MKEHGANSGGLILLADDDANIRSVFAFVLEQHGYEALLAKDGGEATMLAISRRPQAVFLDAWMPGMDGIEACEKIRRALGPEIPIVVISGDDNPDVEARALKAGATKFLGKPFEYERMLELIEQERRAAVGSHAEKTAPLRAT